MSNEGAPLRDLTAVEQNTAQAVQDLDDILALQKGPAYRRYFLRRLEEKRKPLESALLTEDLSEKEAARRRGALAMLKEIETMLEEDERGNRSIIAMRHLPAPK